VGRERFELSTFRLSAERSSQAELPAPDGVNYYRLWTVFKGFRNSFYWFAAILEWARSPVWIKAPAFGAGERGFKSPRVRQCSCNGLDKRPISCARDYCEPLNCLKNRKIRAPALKCDANAVVRYGFTGCDVLGRIVNFDTSVIVPDCCVVGHDVVLGIKLDSIEIAFYSHVFDRNVKYIVQTETVSSCVALNRVLCPVD
jgi:hypothetical protein